MFIDYSREVAPALRPPPDPRRRWERLEQAAQVRFMADGEASPSNIVARPMLALVVCGFRSRLIQSQREQSDRQTVGVAEQGRACT